MASILKVDTIQDQSGNNIINENADTITIGASGDTITVPTGASLTVPNGGLTGQNYPAFEAYLSSNFGIVSGAVTKAPLNLVTLDTNSCYDNTTNYRFTPTVAGKYYVYGLTSVYAGSSSRIEIHWALIYKNGVQFLAGQNDYRDNNSRISTSNVSGIIDMNGTTDYIELYVSAQFSAGSPFLLGQATYKRTLLGAYRIGS